MRMPGQRHQRFGAARGDDLAHRGFGGMGQRHQCENHNLAVAGQRRIFHQQVVQRAPGLGFGHQSAGGIGRGAIMGGRAFLQFGPQFLVQMGAHGIAEPGARRQPLNQISADETADALDGAGGQIGAQRQRQMPGLYLLGFLDDLFQRGLADLGVGIDQQRRHRGHIQRLHQLIRHVFAQRPAPGDGGQHVFHLAAGNHLDQVSVRQQRRIFQDGRRHDAFQVARQGQRHIARHAIQMLDLFRQDGAHLDRGIPGQAFQRFDGQGDGFPALTLFQTRHQPRDFGGEFGAHFGFRIVGQITVQGCRRGLAGGHGLAGGRRTMFGQIFQYAIADIGMVDQIRLSLPGADFQNVQRIARIKARRRRRFAHFHDHLPVHSVALRLLTAAEETWFPRP